MQEKGKSSKKLDNLDYQMLVVKDFIDEFYNKTVFKDGENLGTELSPSFIKPLFAFIEEDKEYPIGELGKNARVKKSTITDMVDRLEKDGIAERVRDDGDRRVVKVRLTAKGKRVRKEFVIKRRDEIQNLFSKLEKKETWQLIYHMNEAYKILKKI